MKREIPIFFLTDENYLPYMDVAIGSLVENASREYNYRIIVLNTGLSENGKSLVKRKETPWVRIDFIDISRELEGIKSSLRDVYHFSIVTYYRLFIASLFPQYDKVIYLDCDLVVLGDISRLYNTELGDNILAGAPEQFIRHTDEFRAYTETALGLDPDKYVNAGVLVMNLAAFRKGRIEESFVHLLTKYGFDLLDPDQAYLNYLCRDRIHILPNGWNFEPMPVALEGERSIVHYALYKKPWQYDDVIDGEYFWEYAKRSPFYGVIMANKSSFGAEQKRKKEETARRILEHALAIAGSECTFKNMLSEG